MGMVEAFRELGHEVEMDCLAGCDPFEKNVVPEVSANGDGAHRTKRETKASWLRATYRLIADRAPQFVFGMLELSYNIPLLARLWRKLRRRPDFVYERYALGNFAPALLCRLMRIPLVVEVNDSIVIERSRPMSYSRVKRAIERRILSSAQVVITVSERFKTQLLQAFPDHLNEERILICPNAVSERRFVPPADRIIRCIYPRSTRGHRMVLGSAGQFVNWHGLPAFIIAMSSVAKERDLEFLFIGDGPVRSEVLDVSRANGVDDRVTFTGMIPHALIPHYLSRLDIAVIPSSNVHGSPMKLMEFMAMGLPVIAPNLPPILEVIKDGSTGRIFRAGDMEDMRRCVEETLDQWDDAREIGRNARKYVLTHLTWDSHARTIIAKLAS